MNRSPEDWVFWDSRIEDEAGPRRTAEGFDRREARMSRPARSGCDYAPPCVPPFEIFDR